MDNNKITKLVVAAQKGDSAALNDLFNATYNDIYYFAVKTLKNEDLACDITQETFITIINNLNSLKEPGAFMGWAKKIAYSQCTRYFNKKKDVLVEEDEDGNSIFDTVAEDKGEFIPDEALDQDEFKKTVHGIINDLSEEQRSAIMMYYFDELSVKEIAEIQGVSEGTIKSRLNYGRKTIKNGVEDYEKKHNTKLHAIPFFPFFKWLFDSDHSKGIMPFPFAVSAASAISAATGTTITVAKVGVTAGAVATAGISGIFAKLVSLPLLVKLVAGILAVSLIATGIIALFDNLKNSESGDAVSNTGSENPDEESSLLGEFENGDGESVSGDEASAEEITDENDDNSADDGADDGTDNDESDAAADFDKEALMKHGEEIANALLKNWRFEYNCFEKLDEYELENCVFDLTEPLEETEYEGSYFFKVSELEANALKYFGKEMGYKSWDNYDSKNDTVRWSFYNTAQNSAVATDCVDLGDGKYSVKINVYDNNNKFLDTANLNLIENENGYQIVNIVNDNHHYYNDTEIISFPNEKGDGKKRALCTHCGKEADKPYIAEEFIGAIASALAESFGANATISQEYVNGGYFTGNVISLVSCERDENYDYIYKVEELEAWLMAGYGITFDWSTKLHYDYKYDAATNTIKEEYAGPSGGNEHYWAMLECVRNDDGTYTAIVGRFETQTVIDMGITEFVAVTYRPISTGFEFVSYGPAHSLTRWEIKDDVIPTLKDEKITLVRRCWECGFEQTREAWHYEKYAYYAEMFLEFWGVDPKTATVDEIFGSLRMFAVDPEQKLDDGYTEIYTLESLDKASLQRYGKTYDWTTSRYYDAESNKLVYYVKAQGDMPNGVIEEYGYTENSDGSITFKIVEYNYEYIGGKEVIVPQYSNVKGEITVLPKEDTTILLELKYY